MLSRQLEITIKRIINKDINIGYQNKIYLPSNLIFLKNRVRNNSLGEQTRGVSIFLDKRLYLGVKRLGYSRCTPTNSLLYYDTAL